MLQNVVAEPKGTCVQAGHRAFALCHMLYVINMRLAMCVVSHTSVSFAVETLHHLHPYSALPLDIDKYLFKRIRVLEQNQLNRV